MTNSNSNDYIKYIAALAKLSLNDNEMHALANDMKDIIGLMDAIKETDTDNIDATEHISRVTNNMREDNPGTSTDTDKILSNSKHTIDNCFAIPKMIE
ncbi:aspartyl/glutamyl-tRNA(Asn/Gln) amidotransferase subunit C [Ruminiclostridium sufflavum DSM 19573]|uniref:Aspartyl/glutamyl-tRNA(Asn/Gln) amidotransferase subunit C n=1 Tax=Ruminiclostridium sufflavum DSM 19573 TaxID=1121337 RepID=A0A318XJM4_9FIRM|nr:Asp-tRNA(Asn)/Glu-tRNA(Gln) amidotransferase subunit GatC [Ruminiclostridium sufflavum]PYG86658.1 aspartyl/glutamyl-tRNA(Asn/Gln) amidotransferase subunit C [Ruminiclostridium sufflavum DSM 19573]